MNNTVWVLTCGIESSREMKPLREDMMDLAVTEKHANEMYDIHKQALKNRLTTTWNKNKVCQRFSLDEYLNEKEETTERERIYFCGMYRLILRKYKEVL